MASETPAELDARAFIDRYDRGELPEEFVMVAAQGFLPLPQDEMVAILAFLSVHEQEKVAGIAHASLVELPARVTVAFARNPDVDPRHLGLLARASEDPIIIEALLRNRSTPDETIRDFASTVSGPLQEIIVINHERLIRSPEIVDALEANPELSNDVRRRITEVREEFFEKKRIEQIRIGDYSLTPEEETEFADLLQQADALGDQPGPPIAGVAPSAEGLDAAEEEVGSIWNQVQKMTISQRVRCAIKGGRTERSILIKDRNRLVAGAVIKNPRISESEIEMFAGMRNIEEEALRLIGMKREWMQKYPLMLSLARNPKAPIGVVLPLINRLTLKDLKSMTSDKNVSETVRGSARRLYNQRKKT